MQILKLCPEVPAVHHITNKHGTVCTLSIRHSNIATCQTHRWLQYVSLEVVFMTECVRTPSGRTPDVGAWNGIRHKKLSRLNECEASSLGRIDEDNLQAVRFKSRAVPSSQHPAFLFLQFHLSHPVCFACRTGQTLVCRMTC